MATFNRVTLKDGTVREFTYPVSSHVEWFKLSDDDIASVEVVPGYLDKWHEERERKAEAIRDRLERGLKPRSNEETSAAFVLGHYHGRGRFSVWSFGWYAYPILHSYNTPIGFRIGDVFYESVETYSPTTSRHLSQYRSALIDAGYVMVKRDVRLAPPEVSGGWLRRDTTPFQRWEHKSQLTDGKEYDSSDSAIMGGVWVSPNGLWSIVRNMEPNGKADIAAIVLKYGRSTMAHVFTSGYVRNATSVAIPEYVQRAIAEHFPAASS